MAINLPSLYVPTRAIPQTDTSWLGGLADLGGEIVGELGTRKQFGGLSDLITGTKPAEGQQGGFLSRILGGEQKPASESYAAPVTPVERGPVQKGDTYKPFIETVRAGGLTNPYGLAAVAATGRAESGWSSANANRTWSDPSESGQAGTAGGILSWRGPRYQALAATGDMSPEGQARFFLQENPQLIQALNSAKSPEEAADIMANAWRFAGYNRSGGEAARRKALARNYYAQEFSNMPTDAASAIEAVAPSGGASLSDEVADFRQTPEYAAQFGEQGDGGFDAGRFGDVIIPPQGEQQLASALQQGNENATAQPTETIQQPVQVADASGGMPQSVGGSNMLAQGVTPVQAGGVNPEIIQYMLRSPALREFGLKLWQQNVTGKTGEPWQFVTLPDGTLARANQQTGSIERIGNFAKPEDKKPPQLVELFDEKTGQPYKARYNPDTMEYERVGGMKAPNGMQITTNPDGTVSITQGGSSQNPKLTEQQSKDLVYYRRGSGALQKLDKIAEQLTSGWGALAERLPGGNYLKSSEYQQAQQAGLEFLQAILRKDTGAAITKQEQDEYGKVYLPQPGDSSELLLQKQQARARALEAIRKGLGPAEILAGERPNEAVKGSRTSSGVQWSIEE